MKRLFLFAAYDRDGTVDDTLTYYLGELSRLGDLVVVMDNDTTDNELAKIKSIPNVLYAAATRHGEYDFGSYKRAYQYARDNKILENYDWVYLVNDSVLGPLYDISPILKDLESRGVDFTGMVSNSDEIIPLHIQSWFVGISQKIFQSNFFDDFMNDIKRQDDKDNIVLKYEIRLSRIIIQRGYKSYAYSDSRCNDAGFIIYANPLETLKKGIPFIKKASLGRIKGTKYLIQYAQNTDFLNAVFANANRYNITLDNSPRRFDYKKCFRFTFLSIPLCTIYHQNLRSVQNYKAYIFDKIPVLKISFRKAENI